MYGYIPLKEASESLGININIMHGTSAPKSIKKYIVNKGTANQLFDINGYKNEKDIELEVIEKTTLLIEYLYHIENIEYSHMRRIAKTKITYITTLDFTFKRAKIFLIRICEYDNELIVRFGDYYDFGSRFEKTIEEFCNNRKDNT